MSSAPRVLKQHTESAICQSEGGGGRGGGRKMFAELPDSNLLLFSYKLFTFAVPPTPVQRAHNKQRYNIFLAYAGGI